ncbi:hypothetical protein PUNSTDRAFT_137013 [Punctularia strigosozonata HHB-11173 SS5]|uniref:uncharacterized protein n=1 Tax=Punctularia strigosozonata (strain HHB-11173) TaxID=741275 RepID=UPI000441862C|nr:uncharacterized protein PUNSTDRAFT_137013 [Punctularia strigosozonata HHB-11173 SS5]EIN06228.1 hypothetical protein PUNSTDRAFT_137013 [Punctularia strigosozonata HHB-11173 SS5]
MAQAVFEDHPLGEYLKGTARFDGGGAVTPSGPTFMLTALAETGERADIMPGASHDFVPDDLDDDEVDEAYRLSVTILHLLEAIKDMAASTFTASHRTEFAERFKYDVISSSLLSTAITPSPHPLRHSFPHIHSPRTRSPSLPPVPGRLRFETPTLPTPVPVHAPVPREDATPQNFTASATATSSNSRRNTRSQNTPRFHLSWSWSDHDRHQWSRALVATACFAAAARAYAIARLSLALALLVYFQPWLRSLPQRLRRAPPWKLARAPTWDAPDRRQWATALVCTACFAAAARTYNVGLFCLAGAACVYFQPELRAVPRRLREIRWSAHLSWDDHARQQWATAFAATACFATATHIYRVSLLCSTVTLCIYFQAELRTLPQRLQRLPWHFTLTWDDYARQQWATAFIATACFAAAARIYRPALLCAAIAACAHFQPELLSLSRQLRTRSLPQIRLTWDDHARHQWTTALLSTACFAAAARSYTIALSSLALALGAYFQPELAQLPSRASRYIAFSWDEHDRAQWARAFSAAACFAAALRSYRIAFGFVAAALGTHFSPDLDRLQLRVRQRVAAWTEHDRRQWATALGATACFAGAAHAHAAALLCLALALSARCQPRLRQIRARVPAWKDRGRDRWTKALGAAACFAGAAHAYPVALALVIGAGAVYWYPRMRQARATFRRPTWDEEDRGRWATALSATACFATAAHVYTIALSCGVVALIVYYPDELREMPWTLGRLVRRTPEFAQWTAEQSGRALVLLQGLLDRCCESLLQMPEQVEEVLERSEVLLNEMLQLLQQTQVRVSRQIQAQLRARQSTTASTIQALNELISAGALWDSCVHEALAILESDERASLSLSNSQHNRFSFSFSSPSMSPTFSPLRVALHSSLHTTASQCEKVRGLLSALTAPAELAQLAEMYAPPSPQLSPLSPERRARPISTPAIDKRSTWNGSYSALARSGSLPHRREQRMSIREKHRSDMSALLGSPLAKHESVKSAPATPARGLPGVREEDGTHARDTVGREEERGEDDPEEEEDAVDISPRDHFGAAAMNLRRRRRYGGLEALALGMHSSSSTNGLGSPPSGRERDSFGLGSSSRFTTLQRGGAHPLSLHALHHAVQAALASKRYACAHLLALRFDEPHDQFVDDEDGDGGAEAQAYWEDVRSVMALLTSTFVDAAARLGEALDDAESRRMREATPSPAVAPLSPATPSAPHSRMTSFDLDAPINLARAASGAWREPRTVQQMVGFAPMPSHMARFAQHVDAMSSALADARAHLERCVAALRDGDGADADAASGTSSDVEGETEAEGAQHSPLPPQEAPALKAYDRLRRELGFALRECERGRERLLDALAAQNAAARDDEGGAGPDEDADDVPLLAPDTGSGSDDSDRHLSGEYQNSVGSLLGAVLENVAVVEDAAPPEEEAEEGVLGGAEQVFEAEAVSVGAFNRERSKLSREERIKLAKAQREKGLSGLGIAMVEEEAEAGEKGIREKWGPGGDVVQELKDVIWQVGERRRKLAAQPPPMPPPSLPLPPTPPMPTQ